MYCTVLMNDSMTCHPQSKKVETSPNYSPPASEHRTGREEGDDLSGPPAAKIYKKDDSGSSPKPVLELESMQLWKAFSSVGNEMIVTKLGRRIFPAIDFELTGLEAAALYTISLKFANSDKYRYRYTNHKWQRSVASDADHDITRMTVMHPLSPSTGSQWMNKAVSFKSVKITHHQDNTNGGKILLHSMHKYHCDVLLTKLTPDKMTDSVVLFPLHLTEFIAVTSYQSPEIIDLKVSFNPFAKGFKDKKHLEEQQLAGNQPLPDYLPSNYGIVPPVMSLLSTPPPSLPYPPQSLPYPRLQTPYHPSITPPFYPSLPSPFLPNPFPTYQSTNPFLPTANNINNPLQFLSPVPYNTGSPYSSQGLSSLSFPNVNIPKPVMAEPSNNNDSPTAEDKCNNTSNSSTVMVSSTSFFPSLYDQYGYSTAARQMMIPTSVNNNKENIPPPAPTTTPPTSTYDHFPTTIPPAPMTNPYQPLNKND